MKRCIKINVHGKVQGVSYREFVQKKAFKLNIEGTIQNLEDKKSVLILACGLSVNLEKFIDYLYEGSPKSDVEDVQEEPLFHEKNFRGVFRIIGE
jgi:acylphosphatase